MVSVRLLITTHANNTFREVLSEQMIFRRGVCAGGCVLEYNHLPVLGNSTINPHQDQSSQMIIFNKQKQCEDCFSHKLPQEV